MRRALILISTLYAAPVITPDGRVWFTVQQGFGRFLDAVGRESSPYVRDSFDDRSAVESRPRQC